MTPSTASTRTMNPVRPGSAATQAAAPALDDAGKLVLRLALGVLILLHGLFKLQNGAGFITGMLEKAGLPGALGYLVYVGEILAPLLVIAGIATRAALPSSSSTWWWRSASSTWASCSR